MDTRSNDDAATSILQVTTPIADAGDALAVVAAAFEQGAMGVLLDESCLPPAFFDLSTRFAGEFVQKLLNYRLRVALVIRDAAAYSSPFQRFVAEARHGRQFRTFEKEGGAMRWLAGEEGGAGYASASIV